MAISIVIRKSIAGILLTSCFLLLGSLGLSAQNTWFLVLDGTVTSQNDRSKLEGVKIVISKNGARFDQVSTDSKGKFSIKLPPDAKYLLEFTHTGYVTKRIAFSTKMVPPEASEIGDFPFPFDMTLFKEMQGLDVSVLNKPLAEVAFDPAVNGFNYDKEYTKSVKAQIEKLQADLEAQMAAAEAEAKEKEKDYQKSMADGNKAMASGDYAIAKAAFAAALVIKPEDSGAKSKLDDAQKRFDKDVAERNQEKAYKEAIENAEMALHDNDYKEAEAQFQKALDVKPGDIYARDQLKEIKDKMVAEAKAEQTYITAIGKADAALAVKDYLTAKAEYTKASEAKPSDKYAKDQLAHVGDLLIADAKKESEYIKAIERGESSMDNKDYEAAKAAFEQASSVKPEEKYPKEQITKIAAILAEIALKNKNYDEAIKRGDASFAKNEFEVAKKAYEEALAINPVQQYPKDQIAAINQKVADMEKLNAQYADLIKGADERYTSKDFISAKAEYTKALAIKPSEVHPKTRIEEISKILEKEAKVDADYKAALSNADNAFKGKDYNSAKFEYEAASKLKPEEVYPKDQLAKVATFLAEIAKKDEDYTKAIAEGDAKMKASEFELAKTSYTQAASLKPEEQYPKDQLKLIDAKLVELANVNKKYAETVATADKQFAAGDLEGAKTNFEAALGMKPSEAYPKEKIAAITAALADLKKKDESYNQFVSQGDAAFQKKDYAAAKTAYASASELKPTEKYPKDKVAEIDALQAQMAALQKQYDEAIAKADAKFNNNELEAALPLYQAAAGLKEGESYPINQIALIDKRLEDAKKKDESYAKAIAAAEGAEKSSDLSTALAEFKNAASIKPEESYPKEKITAITALIADKEKKDAAYKEAIALADEAKKGASYDIALTQYKKASELKPEESYPKDQIKEVDGLKLAAAAAIALAKKQDDDYKALIADADAKFDKLQYEDSKVKYQAALDIKPTENYPKTRIAEIDKAMAGLMAEQEKNEKYSAAIALADKSFNSKDWTGARSKYQEAQAIKPQESYPGERIKAIETAMAEEAALASQQEKDAKYTAAITAADQAFNGKDYDKARSSYQTAKSIKPEETYPTQQLTAIDNAIAAAAALAAKEASEAQLREREEKYTSFIGEGDKAFKAKDWENARTNYQQAKGIKPQEAYPDQQLKAIDEAIAAAAALAAQQASAAQAKEKDDKYNAAIALGDKSFNAKDYENARSSYQQAKGIKPQETYPDQQLKAIDEAIAAAAAFAAKQASEAQLKEKEEKYAAAIVAGDQAFKAKDWSAAKTSYQQAKSIKPSETYPDSQLQAIDEAIAAAGAMAAKEAEEAKLKEKEAKYTALIAAGDKAFSSKQWENARENYQQALSVKPSEAYPKNQLNLIDSEIQNQAMGEKKKEYDAYISSADNAFKSKDWESARSNYESALRVLANEQYPKDQLKRIDEAESKANSIALQSKQDENYRQLIGDADQLFNGGDYQASKSKYQEALGVKPTEVYPKTRIEEIDGKLQALAAAAGKDAEYDRWIGEGDSNFDKGDYSSARNAYTKALAIKSETYPKNRISEIDRKLEAEKATLLANKQSEIEKQQRYDKLVAEGDKNFSAKNYTSAKTSYQSALDIKPGESYPKGKLNEINDIMSQQAVAAKPVVAKKSSGMSDAEIAAMMAKWQAERDQAKVDKMNQYQTDLKETSDERVKNADERRDDAGNELDNLETDIASSNKAGENRNLEEAMLVEEIRKDQEKFNQDMSKDSQEKREDIYDDLEENEMGQREMKEKGNELYQVNTELNTTEKIELQRAENERMKDAHNDLLVAHEEIVELEEGLKEEKEGHQDDHMRDVEQIQKDNELLASTFRTWDDDSRENRNEEYEKIVKQEKDISEFNADNAESYMVNTEKYNKEVEEVKNYAEQKSAQSTSQRTKSYNEITDYSEEVAEVTLEKNNLYSENNEKIRKENQAIMDQEAQMAAEAAERRQKFDRNFYQGEKKPRLPEVAREYRQGVTEETYEEDDAYVVKRIVVNGEDINEYQKVFYKWGGVYYKKNGRDVTEVIWNTETQ